MRTRKRSLPQGWYPSSAQAIRERIRAFLDECPPAARAAAAAIAPHAGWDFSGAVAASVLASLNGAAATVVVVGGHLGPRDPILAAFEDAYETPLGPVEADTDLLEEIRGRVPVSEDRVADNSVEVHLPLVHALMPRVRVLAMRAPPSSLAGALGDAVHAAAGALGRDVVLAGSTDLTHYGPSYGFAPMGAGEAAARWVREVNDRRFIDAVVALDGEGAVRLALSERSACSAGAAAAAIAFARARGAAAGRLLHYRTSLDVLPSPSFVGYAGVLFAV